MLLVLPYLGVISLQTRAKLQQALKVFKNCCKLETVFKGQTRLFNFFRFKDHISKDLISGNVYKLQCGLCNESYYGESIKHLDIRSGEHIGVSPLVGKKFKTITVQFVIIYYSAIIYLFLTTLQFWLIKLKKAL